MALPAILYAYVYAYYTSIMHTLVHHNTSSYPSKVLPFSAFGNIIILVLCIVMHIVLE